MQLSRIRLVYCSLISEMKEEDSIRTSANLVDGNKKNLDTNLSNIVSSNTTQKLSLNDDTNQCERTTSDDKIISVDASNIDNASVQDMIKDHEIKDEDHYEQKSVLNKKGRQLKTISSKNKKRRRSLVKNVLSEGRMEKEREKRQQRYLNSREEKIEKQREYYSKNRERMVEKQADYYKANRQEVIARQYEYYQRNKNKITEKKRLWYQEKRGFVSTKKVIHPSLVETISPHDPLKEGSGTVKIKHLRPIIHKFNKEMNKKWKVVYDVQDNSDFISNCCVSDDQMAKPGESKLDSESDNTNIMTLPPGYIYRAKPLTPSDLAYVESFAALAVSKDGESLDVRYLLHRDNITLEGIRDLFHAIQSVLDIDMHDFMTEKQSLFFINPTCLSNPVLKNRFCKQVCIAKNISKIYYDIVLLLILVNQKTY